MRIIAGDWGGRRIAAPPGRDTRPTADRVREALMSMLAAELPAARVLDLFAGSGALGLEALSRGAAHATFVEAAERAVKVLRANVRALDAGGKSRIVAGDVFRFLDGVDPYAFDLAFADPPYGRELAAALAQRFLDAPFAALLVVEHRKDDALPDMEGARSRRYRDTYLTLIPAPE